ncbi:MAG TPA: hypothetical protein PLR04_02140 [Bacilli bacterium]|nr:hypothetical protein [Bacilli bacterium]
MGKTFTLIGMKKKLDDLTKAKLIYSGEILLFAIIFLALGVLFLTRVIAVQDYKKWLFPILTMLGGIWNTAELIWALISPNKRKKTSLLDKWLLMPASLAFLGFGSYALIAMSVNPANPFLDLFFPTYIGVTILYSSAVYFFQSIYHFYFPVPALIIAVEEDRKASEKQLEESDKKADKNEENREKDI